MYVYLYYFCRIFQIGNVAIALRSKFLEFCTIQLACILISSGTTTNKRFSLIIISGSNRYLTVCISIVSQILYAEHHLIIITHTHRFHDTMFEIVFHSMVKSRKPICLICKDTYQRNEYKNSNMFKR